MLRLEATSEPSSLPGLDYWLLGAGMALIALGLVMVASASMPVAENNVGEPLFYLFRQSVAAVLGLLLGMGVLQIPVAFWYRIGPVLLVLSLILLILVLVPAIGTEVNGSTRWIRVGPMNVQVSEPIKLFMLIYVAGYLQRHASAVQVAMMAMLRPMLVLGVLAMLLLLEPDFGAAAVLIATAVGMVFLAGVNIAQFASLQASVIGVMGALLYFSDYRRARLMSFLDPWADPFNSGFQLTQSLIAIGRGELLGVGLGASVQKLFYLPEAHTDFLFAILAEELGLVGVLVVLGLYAILVYRAFLISAQAERAEMPFACYLAFGIGLLFALQTLINLGVNMGVLPTKGLTLPLMSYGGSSLVVMCVSLAILLRIDLETRPLDPLYQRRVLRQARGI